MTHIVFSMWECSYLIKGSQMSCTGTAVFFLHNVYYLHSCIVLVHLSTTFHNVYTVSYTEKIYLQDFLTCAVRRYFISSFFNLRLASASSSAPPPPPPTFISAGTVHSLSTRVVSPVLVLAAEVTEVTGSTVVSEAVGGDATPSYTKETGVVSW